MREQMIYDVIRDVLCKAPRFLHELGLGFFVQMGARGVRTAIPHAHHHCLKFFATRLLRLPRAIAVLVACVVVATLIVASHGFSDCFELLHACGCRHRAFEMAREIVSTGLVAFLRSCH